MAARTKKKKAKKRPAKKTGRWSGRVTRESHALALEDSVFKKDSARAIAFAGDEGPLDLRLFPAHR